MLYKVSASYCNESDTEDALLDNLSPANSNDHSIPRFTWWPHKGTKEWVQCEFTKPKKVAAVKVYWYDDVPGGGCSTPESCRVLCQAGKEWKEVAKIEPISKDNFNRAIFDTVETTGLRLEVQLKPGFSGGILEWKIE
jgi:hypothetical protein